MYRLHQLEQLAWMGPKKLLTATTCLPPCRERIRRCSQAEWSPGG